MITSFRSPFCTETCLHKTSASPCYCSILVHQLTEMLCCVSLPDASGEASALLQIAMQNAMRPSAGLTDSRTSVEI